MREPWLDRLEETLATAELGVGLVTLAAVAGRDIELNEEELRGAARRALLVLAAGGDPERGLDVHGPAVISFARDVDRPERRGALEAGLSRLRDDSVGLPHIAEATRALLDDTEIAWRAYSCALLAERLGED